MLRMMQESSCVRGKLILFGDLAAVDQSAFGPGRAAFAFRDSGLPALGVLQSGWGGRHASSSPLTIGQGLGDSRYRPKKSQAGGCAGEREAGRRSDDRRR